MQRMSMTFTKLFSSITASTIWAARDQTRILWITMLAMADQHGRVWASIPGLANIARISLEDCEKALEELQAPDKYSRTKDHDGRRIEPIDGGWRLLNHAKYRAIRDEESIKESKRRYINARREKERSTVEGVEQCRTTVDRSRANTEAEAEAEITPPNPRKRGQGSPEGFERFWQAWPAGIRKVAKAQCLRRWQAAGCEAFTDRVLASVRDHKASADWMKDGGAFIPAPLVWLNQSRWEAVLEPAPSASLIASGEAERERQRQQAVIAVPTPAWARELASKLKRAG
jgi:hypothetical protein